MLTDTIVEYSFIPEYIEQGNIRILMVIHRACEFSTLPKKTFFTGLQMAIGSDDLILKCA